MDKEEIIVLRGKVKTSNLHIFHTKISTCVSVCLYHPLYAIGGITHISGSRKDDTSPSARYIKKRKDFYYYADEAIQRLLYLVKKRQSSIKNKALELVIVGGIDLRGPILETLSELGLKVVNGDRENVRPKIRTLPESRYGFKLVGYDIAQKFHRIVRFDTSSGIITVNRGIPFSIHKRIRPKIFYL
jgi:chemotaxis receptor (MCP) glutamine deamidase CheD